MLVHGIQAETVYSQREFTVRVEPGTTKCFYERTQKNQIIDFEYQVIDGEHGDLDISFELQNPNGHAMITEYKKSDNIHRFDAIVEGDYRFCFDNSFSSFNTKTVFFELIIEWDGTQGVDGGAREIEWSKDVLDNAIPDQLLKERVCFAQINTINSIRLHTVALILKFHFFLQRLGGRDSRVGAEITRKSEFNAAFIGYSAFKRGP